MGHESVSEFQLPIYLTDSFRVSPEDDTIICRPRRSVTKWLDANGIDFYCCTKKLSTQFGNEVEGTLVDFVYAYTCVLRFYDDESAVLFKLMWDEDLWDTD